jgi:hypothetical protein
MLLGAAQCARVRFRGRVGLPGADVSATVMPGGDIGFDEEAESRENEGGVAPPKQGHDATPQAPRTIPAGSSEEGSSPGPE